MDDFAMFDSYWEGVDEMTIREKLRSMSSEDLSIQNFIFCPYGKCDKGILEVSDDEADELCKNCIKEWLDGPYNEKTNETITENNTKTEASEKSSEYWENICDTFNRQRRKGIETYGQTLEENQLPKVLQRIDYLQEELIDALMYCEWIKDELRRLSLEQLKENNND